MNRRHSTSGLHSASEANHPNFQQRPTRIGRPGIQDAGFGIRQQDAREVQSALPASLGNARGSMCCSGESRHWPRLRQTIRSVRAAVVQSRDPVHAGPDGKAKKFQVAHTGSARRHESVHVEAPAAEAKIGQSLRWGQWGSMRFDEGGEHCFSSRNRLRFLSVRGWGKYHPGAPSHGV